MNKTLPVEELRELFFLDKKGVLSYRKSGKPVQAKTSNGYRAAYVGRTLFLAHRVVWALHYGEWPTSLLDHIDGDRLNNHVSNLRQATFSLNAHNSSTAFTHSKTKVRGVTKAGAKYHARLMVRGTLYLLGNFDSCQEAEQAYLVAKRNKVKELYAGQ